VVSYAISVLLQPRSMLTEGLSKKGLHLSSEYGIDPLEMVFVGQAMHTSVFALPADAKCSDAKDWLEAMNGRGPGAWSHWQRLFPLVDGEGRLTAALTRSQMMQAARSADLTKPLVWVDGLRQATSVGEMETLRQVATTMAETKLTAYPVVDQDKKLKGIITIEDLLLGRTREAQREGDRVRVLNVRWPFGRTTPVIPTAVTFLDDAPETAPSETRETVTTDID
jgi:CIC family chloride channel protein